MSAAASAPHGADAIANRQANAAIGPRALRALGSLDSSSEKRRAGSARGRGGMGNVSISRDPAGVSWRKIQRAIVVTIRSKKQAITDGQEAILMSISTRGSSICVLGRAGLRTRVTSCRHVRWQEAQAAIGCCMRASPTIRSKQVPGASVSALQGDECSDSRHTSFARFQECSAAYRSISDQTRIRLPLRIFRIFWSV